MKNYTIIAGLNDKDTKTQRIATRTAEQIIASIILKYADGATLTRCKGIYKHANGQTVFENSIKCEISGINKENAEQIASEVKTALNQECIYFSITAAEIDFI